MAVLSKFYELATARNSASAVVAVAIVWTLARKASANQRRRFSKLSVCVEQYQRVLCRVMPMPVH